MELDISFDEKVSTHSRAEAAASRDGAMMHHVQMFQHTAARRRLPSPSSVKRKILRVSTHSHPKAAAKTGLNRYASKMVSTHNRPKAAAREVPSNRFNLGGFNTQPPEGGCLTNPFHSS